jgi:hypothetical protein
MRPMRCVWLVLAGCSMTGVACDSAPSGSSGSGTASATAAASAPATTTATPDPRSVGERMTEIHGALATAWAESGNDCARAGEKMEAYVKANATEAARLRAEMDKMQAGQMPTPTPWPPPAYPAVFDKLMPALQKCMEDKRFVDALIATGYYRPVK